MKTYLRVFAAVIVTIALLALAGCSQGSDSTGGFSGAKGAKVVLLTVTQSCDYCAKHTEAFKAKAAAAGIELTVMVNDYDAAEQAQQVNQAIATRPAAVVLWPADATAIKPSLARFQQANIPVIITNSRPEGDGSLWTAYAGANTYGQGVDAAKAMIQGFKEKGFGDSGNVVMVTGVPGTPPAIDRAKGFTEELAKSAPGIKVVGQQPGNWDQTQATAAAASLFTQHASSDIKGVFAQADNMLAGVIVAAKRAGIDPTKTVMVGMDCSVEGYDNVTSGAQYATVLQDPVVDGELAAQTVIDQLEGKKPTGDNFMANKIITKSNLAECAQAAGK